MDSNSSKQCYQSLHYSINKVKQKYVKNNDCKSDVIIITCTAPMDEIGHQLLQQKSQIFNNKSLPTQDDYTTSINQLISEPNKQSAIEYFLSTLFQLSTYLFQKKRNHTNDANNISFDEYLSSVSDEISTYDIHKNAKLSSSKQIRLEVEQSSQQLLECYQRVPFPFFQKTFVLDFGQLTKNTSEIRKKQQKMNDDLDSVEINLFSQIHKKFHEYFKVVSNFEYLNQSLEINIKKNKQARMRINKVKSEFIEKAGKLQKKIIHRQNLQKSLKTIKVIKSLKKLPMIIKQILETSLPYQCLSFLKSTKQSQFQVQGLLCLAKTSQTIKESQALVQMGLNKRYADELYLYLEECQNVNLKEVWGRINSNNCIDTSGLNNSYAGNSVILQQSILQMHPTTSKNIRNEGKQFQIGMILLQSYQFIQFPADLIRIKVSNSLRIFCKKFDSQLAQCLAQVLLDKNDQPEQNQLQQNSQQSQEKHNSSVAKPVNDEQETFLSGVVEKITVIFYVKHLYCFNQIMKDTLDRFLGYLHTLLIQYKQCKTKDQPKFIQLLKEQLSILPAVCKIIIEKLKILMTLKNINGISFTEFKQWIGVLQYWKNYTDSLCESSPLFSLVKENKQIESAINEALKKMILIFNIDSTINELVLNYITAYHSNIINSELQPSLADESWQPVEIPSEFVDVLNNIAQWNEPQTNQNISVTILNDSKDCSSVNKSLSKEYSNPTKKGNKFRVLKSSVLVEGVKYKISVSLLLLCQFIEEYVKMGRSLEANAKFIYERMLDLIEHYNSRTKQLILQAKARQFQKMKLKNISAKVICLVHNCLSVILKLLKEMTNPKVPELVTILITNIENHRNLLINKLAQLIKSKVESTIASFMLEKDQKVDQTNLIFLGVFVKMMQAIDQYLQFYTKKTIFKESMQIFISKYFKELILKGPENANECKMLVERMSFLRQYFPEELGAMEKEVKSMPNGFSQV